MPGLTYYLVRFKYKGILYEWDKYHNEFYSYDTNLSFKFPPVGWYPVCDSFVNADNYDMEDMDE